MYFPIPNCTIPSTYLEPIYQTSILIFYKFCLELLRPFSIYAKCLGLDFLAVPYLQDINKKMRVLLHDEKKWIIFLTQHSENRFRLRLSSLSKLDVNHTGSIQSKLSRNQAEKRMHWMTLKVVVGFCVYVREGRDSRLRPKIQHTPAGWDTQNRSLLSIKAVFCQFIPKLATLTSDSMS